jgi:hypothetical protein
MNLDSLFGQIARQITNHASPNTPGPSYDPSDLLSNLGNIFGQHAQQSGQQFGGYNPGSYESSDNDPFGDPGQSNQQGSNAAFGNIQSSDADPYGDPGAR